ncbi:unnamed protein product [Rotaria sp. Silwood1]|nr:unnamed protein product [Rotaria sp. Silwood1]
MCPLTTICVCTDCFYGDRCQFYAKGIGLTLDDILHYAIKPNINLNNQSRFIKVSPVVTMIIFVVANVKKPSVFNDSNKRSFHRFIDENNIISVTIEDFNKNYIYSFDNSEDLHLIIRVELVVKIR